MIAILRGLIVFLVIVGMSASLAATDTGSLPSYSRVYDPVRNPFEDGRSALKLAQQTGRRVLIEVGGDWCDWCHLLESFLQQHPSIWNRLNRSFVILKVNVSEEVGNAEFLAAFPPARGYPHMYITENNGTIVRSQDTAEFLENGSYSARNFEAFLNRWGTTHE